MNYKNLKRATELADAIPRLEEARKILSTHSPEIIVRDTIGGMQVTLPKECGLTFLSQINVEINKLKEEVNTL